MSKFSFTCPFCNQRLDCDDALDGQVTTCPSCSGEIVPVKPPESSAGTKIDPASVNKGENSGKRLFDKSKSASGTVMSAVRSADDAIRKSTTSKKSGRGFRSRVFSYTDDDGDFKNPLLAEIFYCTGIVLLFVSVIIVVIRVCLDIDDGKCTIPGVYFVAFGVAVDAIFNFGIAQIIHCIGKSCYNTDRIVELMQTDANKKK